MKCVFCGSENEESNKFCMECGKQLQTVSNDEETLEIIEEDERYKIIENFPVNEEKNKKGKKGLIVSLVFIAILALIGGFIGYVYFVKLSPKNVFKSYVNGLYNSYEKGLLNDFDEIYSKIEISPKISGTNNKQLEDIINNLDIKLDGAIDYKSKEMVYNINSNYKDKKLVDLGMQYDNNSVKVLSNLFNNPLMLNVNSKDVTKAFDNKDNNENVKMVLKKVTKAFNASLKDSYFEGHKENFKTIISTVNLTNENVKEITKSVREKLSNDDEFIKSFSKLSETDEKVIKEKLNEKVEDSFSSSDMKITIYTEMFSNKFIKMEMISGENMVVVSNKNDKDTCLVSIKNGSYVLDLEFKYTTRYNEKISKNDVENAVSGDNISPELIKEIFDNLKKQEGYVLLNEDIEKSTGSSIDTVIDSFLGLMSPNNQNHSMGQDSYINQY